MKSHYNLTGGSFAGVTNIAETEDGQPLITLRTSPEIAEVCNVTFLLQVGYLTPTATYELWECLDHEGAEAFREVLAQYYYDVAGHDISECHKHMYKQPE